MSGKFLFLRSRKRGGFLRVRAVFRAKIASILLPVSALAWSDPNSEFEALDFTGGGAWEVVHVVDDMRELIPLQLRLAPLLKLFGK